MCPICGQTPRQVTGKWGPFWSCPKLRTGSYCSFKWNETGTGPKTQTPTTPQRTEPRNNDNSIIRQLSYKVAGYVVSALIARGDLVEGSKTSLDKIKKTLKHLTVFGEELVK